MPVLDMRHDLYFSWKKNLFLEGETAEKTKDDMASKCFFH